MQELFRIACTASLLGGGTATLLRGRASVRAWNTATQQRGRATRRRKAGLPPKSNALPVDGRNALPSPGAVL